MKQKKYNWVLGILVLAVIGGILYVATKDITPITRNIEKVVEIRYEK